APSSLYDAAPIHAATGHPITRRLERWRRAGARKTNPDCATRIAPPGTLLHESGAPWPHVANDSTDQRGLSATYRQDPAAMEEPHAFYGCCCSIDAAHHGGSRPGTVRSQTRRGCNKRDSRRDSLSHRRTGGGIIGA